MKPISNQEKAPEIDQEIEALQKHVHILHLQRDILALTLEIKELKGILNGDFSTEEAEG